MEIHGLPPAIGASFFPLVAPCQLRVPQRQHVTMQTHGI